MALELRRIGDVAKIIRVFEDGSRLVEWANGRRKRIQFKRCPLCKKDRPELNFEGALCLDCQGVKLEAVRGFRCVKPEGIRHYRSERYAQVVQATPSWVDRKAIASIYAEAKRVSLETGILHQVDHIYPITHTEFCGLHVPWNLRIIPSKKNQTKGNKPPLDYLQQITST